ncbi:hypothetical protein [Agrobacterium rosae]|nr:hypothetical protein [Agrobacterium rosae]KAA3507691.1 hypothetical protein DXM21_24560 [Agrobacterium rosae]KAA3512571.1 hypothetical protein DXM25_24750 [Agrobacterium rosae]MQB51276.1 hypothetical protein [Agrobacterium rosae]
MMPSAPTDNLYKFVTVLGVALMIFCAWSSTEAVKRVDEAYIDQLLRDIQTETDRMILSMDTETVKEILPVPVDKRSPEQKQELSDAAERSSTLVEKSVAQLMASFRPIMLQQQSENELLMYRIGTGIGALISLIGIACWYFLHQRYQDAILRRQFVTETKPTEVEAD